MTSNSFTITDNIATFTIRLSASDRAALVSAAEFRFNVCFEEEKHEEKPQEIPFNAATEKKTIIEGVEEWLLNVSKLNENAKKNQDENEDDSEDDPSNEEYDNWVYNGVYSNRKYYDDLHELTAAAEFAEQFDEALGDIDTKKRYIGNLEWRIDSAHEFLDEINTHHFRKHFYRPEALWETQLREKAEAKKTHDLDTVVRALSQLIDEAKEAIKECEEDPNWNKNIGMDDDSDDDSDEDF